MSRRNGKRQVKWGQGKHRKARVQRFRANQRRKGRTGHLNHTEAELATGARYVETAAHMIVTDRTGDHVVPE